MNWKIIIQFLGVVAISKAINLAKSDPIKFRGLIWILEILGITVLLIF